MKFKIGDKVKIINPDNYLSFTLNKIDIILSVNDLDDFYRIDIPSIHQKWYFSSYEIKKYISLKQKLNKLLKSL
jgi:hypothetical protein